MKFDEKSLVQRVIVDVLSQPVSSYEAGTYFGGWRFLNPEEVQRLRNGEGDPLLRHVFVRKLLELNPFLGEMEVQELLRRLEGISPGVEGSKVLWEYLCGTRSVYVQSERRERNIRLIDYQEPENNEFHFTEEFVYTDGVHTIRQDLVFFINGIPLVFVETKSPAREEGLWQALEQVRRYHTEAGSLLAFEQIYCISNRLRFMYAPTWSTSARALYEWKEGKNFEEGIKNFFNKERLLELIRHGLFFVKKEEGLQKVILRPHQLRAVGRVLERAKDPEKKKGLVWHTQGSGKTYTMIAVAKRLLEDPLFENPLVIMLVDRNELEAQLFDNLRAVGFGDGLVEVAQDKNHLKRLLMQRKRGLLVSMIHKFEGMPAGIDDRHNIFVLVDEAHRTTTGKLGTYLLSALPNATFIGFTGTPTDRSGRGKGTFQVFCPEGEKYLDKYSIAQSIEDGTTVPLHYSLAPNELTVDRETLEKEFLLLKDAEGISDPEELDRILDRAVHLKAILKSPDRIQKIAQYIARHYREYVEPLGYKAFVVAVDREACSLYKQELDKHLPPEYSEVVYSPYYNDPPHLKAHHRTPEEEEKIRKNFKDPEKMTRILIVTNKLLTGFDAGILFCLYLDKPMRDHVLLQTIARVNRPYEDPTGRHKTSGLVVDFVGIFKNLEKALAFDAPDMEGVLKDLELLKEQFSQLMKEAEVKYLSLLQHADTKEQALNLILEEFMEEQKREDFYQLFRKLRDLYDLLSPDEFLRPYIERMDLLAEIYRLVRNSFDGYDPIDREFSKKVEELVRKHVRQSPIGDAIEFYEINEETLMLLQKKASLQVRDVFNIYNSISRHIQKELKSSPYLLSIKERLESLMEDFKNRQKTTQETLEELKKLLEEILQAQTEKAQKELDMESFALYWLLKKEGIADAEKVASEIEKRMQKFPHWKTSAQQERELKKSLLEISVKDFKTFEKVLNYLKQI